MKKTLIALAVLGTVAGVAQAQSNVTIYGQMDIGFNKASNTTGSIGRGDDNFLGFKGREDLGSGLAAVFQLEQRFEPDTGKTENNGKSPQWQGRTLVGLSSATLGTIKLGRDLTPLQTANRAFDPYDTRTVGAFSPFFMGAYNSDNTLESNGTLQTGNAKNRFSNAVFYNSPVVQGFAFDAAVASKEGTSGLTPSRLEKIAYSAVGKYNNGPLALMVGFERNAISDKFSQVAGSYKVGVAKLMATYSQFKQESLDAAPRTRIFTLGADIDAGPGSVKVGYGKINPDGSDNTTRKFSAGYWYNLSKRTNLYFDGANLRADGSPTVKSFDLGIHHSF